MTGYCPEELFGIPEQIDRFGVEGKGARTKVNQDKAAIDDSLIMCAFSPVFGWVSTEHYAKLLVASTGIEEFSDAAYLRKAGERIYNLERILNVREGFRRKDDYFPERFLKEPIFNRPSEGQIFEMEILLDDYYRARGWDLDMGIPTEKKLQELGLKLEMK